MGKLGEALKHFNPILTHFGLLWFSRATPKDTPRAVVEETGESLRSETEAMAVANVSGGLGEQADGGRKGG
jgi:hypothetical protein